MICKQPGCNRMSPDPDKYCDRHLYMFASPANRADWDADATQANWHHAQRLNRAHYTADNYNPEDRP